MKHSINISFDEACGASSLIRRQIKKYIWTALRRERVGLPCEINVLVTDNVGIRELNASMRGIDKATDVLSFPMFDLQPGCPPCDIELLDPATGLCPLGDMAISLEKVLSQALEFGHSPQRELGYLTIHSILHLLGYDHVDEGEQKARMRAREEAIFASVR